MLELAGEISFINIFARFLAVTILLTDTTPSNINMFDPLMVYLVVGQMDNTLIITIYNNQLM